VEIPELVTKPRIQSSGRTEKPRADVTISPLSVMPTRLPKLAGFVNVPRTVPNYETTNSKFFIWCRIGERRTVFLSLSCTKLYRRCGEIRASRSGLAQSRGWGIGRWVSVAAGVGTNANSSRPIVRPP
jgi:hypothetical protein